MITKAILAALLSSAFYGLYHVPIQTLAGLLAFTLFYLVYVFWVFKKWNADFSGNCLHSGKNERQ